METEQETYSTHIDYVDGEHVRTLKPDSSAVTVPLPNGNMLFTFYIESVRLKRETLTINKEDSSIVSSSFGDDGSRSVREVIGRVEIDRKQAEFMKRTLEEYLARFEKKDKESAGE